MMIPDADERHSRSVASPGGERRRGYEGAIRVDGQVAAIVEFHRMYDMALTFYGRLM